MIRKHFFIVISILLLFTYCDNKQISNHNTVRLKGQIVGMGQDISMSYAGASSFLGGTRGFTINTDEQGYFDTTFVINEPSYYNISRNILYISPGDDLEMTLTENNLDAEFEGKGSDVNNYMKYRLFPQGGSFLESGRNIVGDFSATKSIIDSLAELRFAQLDTLSNATEQFKKFETARIKADIVNSYMSFVNYVEYAMKSKGLEFKAPSSVEEHYSAIKQDVTPLIKEFSDEKYLDVAVVRNIMSYSGNDRYDVLFEGVEIPARTKELFEAYKEGKKITSDVSPEIVKEVMEYARSMVNKDLAYEIEQKVEKTSRLFSGKPAIDFELEDVDGNKMLLSDFKDKVLYLDLWATWCAPCIQEAPYFESLSKEYAGKEIVFIPISTDTDKEQWLNSLNSNLNQYRSLDLNLSDGWGVVFIPRFILIDKDFNIVNAHALRPSDDKIKEVLDGLLN